MDIFYRLSGKCLWWHLISIQDDNEVKFSTNSSYKDGNNGTVIHALSTILFVSHRYMDTALEN